MSEDMQNMPKIQPRKSYTIQTREEGEALLKTRGFGKLEGQVRMMNLMMVGGSGFEGMEMMGPSEGHGTGHGDMKMSEPPAK